MFFNELLWDSSIEELKKGYVFHEASETFECIMCGHQFTKGVIYKIEDDFVDAKMAMKRHIAEKHQSVFEYLISLDKRYNGLSDILKQVTIGMHNNKSDGEIAEELNKKAKSTIRNHRFSLREKYKEAKIFIALMDLVNENKGSKAEVKESRFIDFHKDIPVTDDRIKITVEEEKTIVARYFDKNIAILDRIPKKHKEKLVVLRQIAKRFESEKRYTEKEVNKIIGSYYEDYVTLRRYLIEYRFMDRKNDCSEYWVK